VDQAKKEWMERVGIKEFKHPMKYHAPGWLLSEEYIRNTSLEELEEQRQLTRGAGREDDPLSDGDK